MKKSEQVQTNKNREKFIKGVDYYFENGLTVLTAHFLLKRGYCCGNHCRHCPYSKENSIKSQ